MIKAMGILDGKRTLLLGLTHKNLDILRADGLNGYMPIVGEELGIPFDIRITCGPTEREILASMAPAITEKTIIHKTERYKRENE